LARSGIVRACLAAVERAALPDLILPTAAAAAKLASVRAALSLLLRLAQLPGGGARALASSGAMAALTNCRAIDAYTSDGPGDAAAVAAQAAVRSSNFNDAGDEYDSMGGLTFDGGSTYGGRDENANPNAEYEGNGRGAYGGQGGSREGSGLANSPIAPLPLPRARHHALLVPVLRLAGTLVNALCAADDGGEMHASGIAFLEAHKSVISRILSDRTRHAHLSDLAELEAAVTLVARLVAHRRGDVNDVVNQGPAGSNTGTPGVPGIQAPINGTPGQSPSALSAHRWRIVDEFVPALDALTAKLITGDGKYDAYIAAGSPDGSPSASTSHAEIARRLAHERAKGYAAFGGTNANNNSGGFPELGGLEPPAAAAAAARMERSLRAVRAALVSTQLALAEQGRATFRATDPNRHLEMDAAANPKPALSNFAGLVARVSEELGCEVRTRVRLLRRLAADGGAAAAAAVAADAFGGFSGGAELAAAAAAAANLNGGSFPFSGAAEASAAAAAVAARERAVRVLSHTCEASLELILGRLWSRPTGTGIQSHGYSVGSSFAGGTTPHSPYGGVGSAFVRDGTAPAQGYTAPNASYSSSEIAELSAILTPAIAALSELTDLGGNPEDGKDTAGGLGQLSGLGDGGRLRGLIRRTRDTLLAAVPAGVAEPPTLLLAGDRSSIGNEFGVGGNSSFGVNSPAGNYPAQSPLPPPRFGLFNA
jgi:nuclear pore complex protein Nup205